MGLAAERLLLGLFWITRVACLAQGLALCTAVLAAPMARRPGASPWLEVVWRSSLSIGATLFLVGVLLAVVRRRPPSALVGDDAEHPWFWPALLGLSFVALSELARGRASDLVGLWREIGRLLEGAGIWDALSRSDPYGGIVLLPILIALFVPALESAAGFFLIVVPLAMIALLLTRSRLVPTIFGMLVVCQAGFVLAGLVSADAFSALATEAIGLMTAAEDVEVHRVAEVLRRAQGILASTATGFVVPMLGYLAWLPVLWWPRRNGTPVTAP